MNWIHHPAASFVVRSWIAAPMAAVLLLAASAPLAGQAEETRLPGSAS